MRRYIAFDVETPNRRSSRMSAIGITVVEDGHIADAFYSLVDPETYFDSFNVRLTGIDRRAVMGAPTFPELWPVIGPMLDSGVLAAHNAPFDLRVLKRCLQDYAVPWKQSVPYLCTVQMGRRLLPRMSHKLDVMCGHYGIPLDHHHAGSDSRACAELLLRYMADGADADRYIRTFSMKG